MIEIVALSLRAGTFTVRSVSLHLDQGEYFVLLGPNGSGKTLLVSCLCGLIRAQSGRILIGGRDVTHLEPRRRRIGYVPQDYGLFPHLDVAGNITFPLEARGLPRRDALRSVSPLTQALGLENLLHRSPATLSGGERQKVALARALAFHPDLLVLDEPVNALDRPTSLEVLDRLREVHRNLRVTTIHICHSIEEASVVADRAGVMIQGQLVQVGDLKTLLEHPANAEVARLLGPAPQRPSC